jgi:hypothetical protein
LDEAESLALSSRSDDVVKPKNEDGKCERLQTKAHELLGTKIEMTEYSNDSEIILMVIALL